MTLLLIFLPLCLRMYKGRKEFNQQVINTFSSGTIHWLFKIVFTCIFLFLSAIIYDGKKFALNWMRNIKLIRIHLLHILWEDDVFLLISLLWELTSASQSSENISHYELCNYAQKLYAEWWYTRTYVLCCIS